jgi:hypothetical protein
VALPGPVQHFPRWWDIGDKVSCPPPCWWRSRFQFGHAPRAAVGLVRRQRDAMSLVRQGRAKAMRPPASEVVAAVDHPMNQSPLVGATGKLSGHATHSPLVHEFVLA